MGQQANSRVWYISRERLNIHLSSVICSFAACACIILALKYSAIVAQVKKKKFYKIEKFPLIEMIFKLS